MRLFCVFLAILIVSACTKQIYVPVESVKTEYRDVYLRDSIVMQDSVFLRVKGDTIYLEKYKTIYKDRILRDSIFKNDTIRIPYPVEVIKYKRDYKFIFFLIVVVFCVLIVSKLKKLFV